MAASVQDIKDFFALSGNNKPVSNGMLTALDTWLEDHTGETGPDALVDYLYTMLEQQVISYKRATSSHNW